MHLQGDDVVLYTEIKPGQNYGEGEFLLQLYFEAKSDQYIKTCLCSCVLHPD